MSGETKVFVDAGRTKTHAVFFPETEQTLKLESLSELLNDGVTEVYVDALFPNILGDLYKLATSCVRVHHLRRLSLVALRRNRDRLEKNDDSDARLLASKPTQEFGELKEDQIRLRMLLNEYYAVADTLKRVKQKAKTTPNSMLADTRKFLGRQRYTLKKTILEDAENSLPQYSLVKGRLGLNGVSLVTLLTYVDFQQGFDKTLRQVGRTAHHKKTRRFSRKAMRALNGLTTLSLRHGNERYSQVYRHYLDTLKSRKKALLRVQTWILKDIHHVATKRNLRETPNPMGRRV